MITRKYYFILILLVLLLIIFYFQKQISYVQIVNRQILDSRLISNKFEQNENKNETLVVIYNRVPKTGSTSFVNVPYDLCKKNKFHVIHINVSENMHMLTLPNQFKLVNNITKWDSIKPALYHGHIAYLDFSKFGIVNSRPLFINLIRKPLDRLVSYYYFLRYGDNYRPYLIRKKHGDKLTFDECVLKRLPDCDPSLLWLQIPFICGHIEQCWKPGNEWALQEAKRNLLNNYLLVGVTEQMTDFIRILELTLPRMFSGSTEYFLNSNKSHLRKTVKKFDVTNKTKEIFEQSTIWKMENEFYEFALQQFNSIKRRTLQVQKYQYYFYEKIRPK